MQSLRQTAKMILPIACVEAIRFFYKIFKKSYIKEDWTVTLKMALLSIANIIAYLTVAVVIKPSHCVLYGGTGIRSVSTWGTGFLSSLKHLMEMSGIQSLWGAENYKQNIILGLISALCICAVIYAIVSTISVFIKYAKANSSEASIEPIYVLILLFLLGVLSIGAMGTLMNIKIRDIFYFMWYPLVTVSLIYVVQKIESKYMICVATSIMTISFIISYGSSALNALSNEKTEEEIVCDFLEENNIHYLYGHWNTVPEIAVYSDGDIIPGGWYTTIYEPVGYLNPKDIYEEEYNNQAAYLILPEEKEEALKIAADRGVNMSLIYETDQYEIYRAEEQLMKN